MPILVTEIGVLDAHGCLACLRDDYGQSRLAHQVGELHHLR